MVEARLLDSVTWHVIPLSIHKSSTYCIILRARGASVVERMEPLALALMCVQSGPHAFFGRRQGLRTELTDTAPCAAFDGHHLGSVYLPDANATCDLYANTGPASLFAKNLLEQASRAGAEQDGAKERAVLAVE